MRPNIICSHLIWKPDNPGKALILPQVINLVFWYHRESAQQLKPALRGILPCAGVRLRPPQSVTCMTHRKSKVLLSGRAQQLNLGVAEHNLARSEWTILLP